MSARTQTKDLFDVVAVMSADQAGGAGLRCVQSDGMGILLAPHTPQSGFKRLLEQAAGGAKTKAKQALVGAQAQLERLHRSGDVLPVQPGPPISLRTAERALIANAPVLAAALKGVAGREQFQVQVLWDQPQVMKRFRDSPEIAALRSAKDVSPVQLMSALDRLRQRLAAEFEDMLTPAQQDHTSLPLDPEAGMILNMASLVRRSDTAKLEAALEQIDAVWPEGLRIRMIGPAPAAAFATLRLTEISRTERDKALATLGLTGDPTLAEVRATRRAALLSGHPDVSQTPSNLEATSAASTLFEQVDTLSRRLVAAGHSADGPWPRFEVLRDEGQALSSGHSRAA
ncbi:MAG: GvpL/GvpF family gas vesicle protein [Pseudomonadota bacterium]